ncbi:hypothetical protein SLS57_008387 [Botryosphaeria dothidea]
MPPKRKPDRPKKIQPISPEKLRPTAKSPPPPLKPKRGRPPKSQKLAPTARVQKRGKLGAIGKASKPNPFFKAKCILNENKTDYLIEWDVTDPKTGKPYEPSWHPKACANKSLVAAWEADKEGEEWAARGIVDEDKYHYKVAWENNPKTGEVYRDTWEPKAYVGEILVKQWQKRVSKERKQASSASGHEETPDSDDESSEPEDDGSDEDALQEQITQEMLASPVSRGQHGPTHHWAR